MYNVHTTTTTIGETVKVHNHSWAAVSMLGQFVSALLCAFETANDRPILLVPTVILVATAILTFAGWEKLELRSELEIENAK